MRPDGATYELSEEGYFDLSGGDDWLLSVPRAKMRHLPVSPQLCSRPIWQGAFNSARDRASRGYPTAAHRISGLIVSRTTQTGAIPSAARWPRIGRADTPLKLDSARSGRANGRSPKRDLAKGERERDSVRDKQKTASRRVTNDMRADDDDDDDNDAESINRCKVRSHGDQESSPCENSANFPFALGHGESICRFVGYSLASVPRSFLPSRPRE